MYGEPLYIKLKMKIDMDRQGGKCPNLQTQGSRDTWQPWDSQTSSWNYHLNSESLKHVQVYQTEQYMYCREILFRGCTLIQEVWSSLSFTAVSILALQQEIPQGGKGLIWQSGWILIPLILCSACPTSICFLKSIVIPPLTRIVQSAVTPVPHSFCFTY